jgi:RND family efflux transporter MFP subunit
MNTHVADFTPRAEQTDETGFLGVVVALQSVELSAKFDGTLERLDVHVGDYVKAGTVIARLDSRSVVQDLAIAEASLLVAEAEHDRLVIESEDASKRRARLQSIPELFAREQLEAADSQEQVAAARLRGSSAELAGKRARTNQLRETLRDARIVAPFDGTVAAQYVDPDTTVSRSTPIVRVISPTSLVIRFAVPEEQATGIAVGRNVAVRVESVNLTADGVIESVVPEIDAALRMVVIEARLTANGGRTRAIPAGAIARVRVAADRNHREQDAAIVPSRNSALGGSNSHERSIN